MIHRLDQNVGGTVGTLASDRERYAPHNASNSRLIGSDGERTRRRAAGRDLQLAVGVRRQTQPAGLNSGLGADQRLGGGFRVDRRITQDVLGREHHIGEHRRIQGDLGTGSNRTLDADSSQQV